jgi:Fe-S cluster biogenesis protein NfuA
MQRTDADVRADVDAALTAVKSRLRGHGGDVAVLDVTDGVVDVDFQGACRGCPAQAFTHVGVLEAALAEVPGVTGVRSSRSQISPAVVERIRRAVRS